MRAKYKIKLVQKIEVVLQRNWTEVEKRFKRYGFFFQRAC